MVYFGTLTRCVFVLLSAALFSACTTAPDSIADFIPTPKKVEVLPPVPKSEPLTTTNTQAEISHDDGVVVAIPATLLSAPPKSTAKKAIKKKKATAAAAAAAATTAKAETEAAKTETAKDSDVGLGFRALESADGCCGTGCSTACLTDTASEGTVVKVPESASATGDVHRALEGSDECCGTGCSKACVVE